MAVIKNYPMSKRQVPTFEGASIRGALMSISALLDQNVALPEMSLIVHGENETVTSFARRRIVFIQRHTDGSFFIKVRFVDRRDGSHSYERYYWAPEDVTPKGPKVSRLVIGYPSFQIRTIITNTHLAVRRTFINGAQVGKQENIPKVS